MKSNKPTPLDELRKLSTAVSEDETSKGEVPNEKLEELRKNRREEEYV